MFG
ncbi:da29ff08-2937-438d-ae4d-196bea5f21cc [Thermothielavioides terrestris]|jgi:hypothetical protein